MELSLREEKLNELEHLPDDWMTKRLNEVCWFQEGPGLRNWQFRDQGIKVINVTNLENGILNLDRTSRYISIEEFNKMYAHFEIDENDIVVASSGNSYSKVAVVRKQDLPLVMNTSVIRFKPLKNLDYQFLLTFLTSGIFKKQIDLLITGGAQPNFGPAHLRKIEVNLPPTLAEQTAIATALSDMDAYIRSLEKLIEKKRLIKQGVMQELLSPVGKDGKMKEGWVVRRLGELGEIITGSTPPTNRNIFWNGTIPWITPTDISNFRKDIKSSEREISNEGLKLLRKLPANTLLVTCIASIGKNAILRKAGACNQQINAILTNENHSVDFLYYLIENNKQYINSKAGITATLIISKRDFSEIEFLIPTSLETQLSIAKVLNELDVDIEHLEGKLLKSIGMKKGMMQQLLTGKIRLL